MIGSTAPLISNSSEEKPEGEGRDGEEQKAADIEAEDDLHLHDDLQEVCELSDVRRFIEDVLGSPASSSKYATSSGRDDRSADGARSRASDKSRSAAGGVEAGQSNNVKVVQLCKSILQEEDSSPKRRLPRRLLWPVLLGLFPASAPRLLEAVRKARAAYAVLRNRHCAPAQLREMDPQLFHPLASRDEMNPWTLQERNQQLNAEIQQDVQRTFPDRQLFQQESTQAALTRILFVWSKQNFDVSYKQGLNELLAVAYLVCARDRLHLKEADPLHLELCSDADVEADAFSLFDRVMQLGMKDMFAPAPPPRQEKKNAITLMKMGREPKASGTALSAIIARCNHIFHSLLRNFDAELYRHLNSLDLEPQLFLLRWVRLLFCREFQVDDILSIWDAIFADIYVRRSFELQSSAADHEDAKRAGNLASTQMPLVDYFAIAMLKFVRANLLQLSGHECLRRLLRFPPVESVSPLTQVALKMRTEHHSETSGFFRVSTGSNI